ncbi:polysaccharide deacetylase family protein [Paenibacillus spongiae]|uniref:Polysaccharide deacetylase family protein n=1 Tax=Paenibacillus spongiae TaxID=2909671 RepID=A0ABY5SAR4_9BACL|nr:polysaccharide deacetylase family protein [Paenibacillus spongiae]UVI30749.1 polysaccharide deacetylase family protein [Paenibacillus spongiae]
MELNERLGFSPEERLLIVNGDDFGMCHAANAGIGQLLAEGVISSATVMIPCAWSAEAAAIASSNPAYDIGIHLTLTCEWGPYKWGPVRQDGPVDTLVTKEGWFPPDCKTVEQQSDSEQVKQELFAQVRRGMAMGIDPTHLDNHMGSVYGMATGRDFLEETLEVCEHFQLPFRLPKSPGDREKHMPPALMERYRERLKSAEKRGVMLIDHLEGLSFHLEPGEDYEQARETMAEKLRSMKAGITEMIIHPFHDTDELKAVMPHWEKRRMEFELFRDPVIRQVLEDEGIRVIGWRALRDAQRSGGR